MEKPFAGLKIKWPDIPAILEELAERQKPKIVYIAHQIAGDITGNRDAILKICKEIHTREILPCAPCLLFLEYLDDSIPKERELGMLANRKYFQQGIINELWLCGPRISDGMKEEIALALKHHIPIKCHNPALQLDLGRIIEEWKKTK
ncbi:hypothetical protein KKD19_02320 [Patescibacteria group bacterium]|nr:hypothetical protein [Patescibacteria group bacterium]MBU4512060.1 hypothetical protein [Patescibacteria group bacterium]MCG2692688.1 hypothetical protein [Candidatus Parcubacteria bacterium]